eukprot:800413-Rhodomonas_salina.3
MSRPCAIVAVSATCLHTSVISLFPLILPPSPSSPLPLFLPSDTSPAYLFFVHAPTPVFRVS